MSDEAPGLLSEALELEHRAIDGGIEAYVAGLGSGAPDRAPLDEAFAGLRRHIYLEEAFVFPPLRAAGMLAPVLVMLREHGELWDAMVGIERRLHAGAGVDELVDACRDLLAALDRHNGKEEPIIYPQADRTLDATATADLKAFIADGTLPDGWVCERAAA